MSRSIKDFSCLGSRWPKCLCLLNPSVIQPTKPAPTDPAKQCFIRKQYSLGLVWESAHKGSSADRASTRSAPGSPCRKGGSGGTWQEGVQPARVRLCSQGMRDRTRGNGLKLSQGGLGWIWGQMSSQKGYGQSPAQAAQGSGTSCREDQESQRARPSKRRQLSHWPMFNIFTHDLVKASLKSFCRWCQAG